jgi:hypothetical protein
MQNSNKNLNNKVMVEKEKLGNKKKYNAKEITVKTQC